MRLPVGRIKFVAALTALGLSGSWAQTPDAPTSTSAGPAAAATATQPAGAAAGTDATGAGASTANALDYIFNKKGQNGTVAKEVSDANDRAKINAAAQDATGNRMDDPQVKARFESFLNMDPVSQDKIDAYAAEIDATNDLLRKGQVFDAWRELYKLADYQELDAGLSGELANRVRTIWDADNAGQQIAQTNEKLQDQADTASRSADMMSDDVRDKEIEYQRRMAYAKGNKSNNQGSQQSSSPTGGVPQMPGSGGDSSEQTPDVSSVMGKMELTDQYLSSLEAKAKIKLNEMKAEKAMDKAQTDFGDYITSTYQAGCYEHVILAAGFYRGVFNQGDYPVTMAQQVNSSLEITRNVRNSINVFKNQIGDNEIAGAADSLETAFITNEFDPALLGVPLDQKKKIETFLKCVSKIQNVIEARDFSTLEDLLNQMKTIAPDFDATKSLAIVNAAKLQSQLQLGKAKLAAQQGDLKSAMEDFQGAAEAWPENPDLKDKALNFFNSEDAQNQSLTEFDRLVADNNYRGIFDKQLMFAPAMKDDTKRQQQLKDALLKVQEAETAIQKANLLATNGDVCGAWETVEIAAKDLPDDLKLNALRGDLAGKGAEFVSDINKAKEAEAKSELGYSLTWYAIAQRAYPASTFANDGIKRLSRLILAKQI